MRKIQLTQSQTAMIDDEDYPIVSQSRWCINSMGYAVRHRKKSEGLSDKISLHRFLMGLQYGDKRQVDHINGNKLDNRRVNLRICTLQQNQMNRTKRKGTSIYKGVNFYKITNKWQASIKFNQKNIHLGYFLDEVEAAKAYNKAAKEHFKDFANLNMI